MELNKTKVVCAVRVVGLAHPANPQPPGLPHAADTSNNSPTTTIAISTSPPHRYGPRQGDADSSSQGQLNVEITVAPFATETRTRSNQAGRCP